MLRLDSMGRDAWKIFDEPLSEGLKRMARGDLVVG
jgi:hypothetical protein